MIHKQKKNHFKYSPKSQTQNYQKRHKNPSKNKSKIILKLLVKNCQQFAFRQFFLREFLVIFQNYLRQN